ncbi:OsmC family protein [Allostreptomyces psammosilenae]|uniref:Organic hydroperoxide reductase OsmC/OhrA n=1 Tax=Allostreptomyces psammosilenae TaxID=1892865 RepID=A0A853A0C8_9ACTN|nr:OsmC family protein [Allostreptomyces psammosilenae]NYI07825.1 organic hydroperoxide reductase OsmC/OhrA [Allostreptomyces psammosilenae]
MAARPPKTHSYALTVNWTGNLGTGTGSYAGYSRDHEITAPGKPVLLGSSDPSFRGDPARYNPEELLVASLSQCHMLWYLGLCPGAGVTVTAYRDEPTGTMLEEPGGAGHFTEVVLRPRITVASAEMVEAATALHERAHAMCFIARSVNFPVRHEPVIEVEPAG